VLIIASMVEKETLSPDERELVSAVIYNRLHAGMPLNRRHAALRLDIPPTESIRQSQLEQLALQHAEAPGCRRRRSRARGLRHCRRRRIRRR
jgi:hypothetical protein